MSSQVSQRMLGRGVSAAQRSGAAAALAAVRRKFRRLGCCDISIESAPCEARPIISRTRGLLTEPPGGMPTILVFSSLALSSTFHSSPLPEPTVWISLDDGASGSFRSEKLVGCQVSRNAMLARAPALSYGHRRLSRPMRLEEGMDLAHRQRNPLLGLLPREHAHFGFRREHRGTPWRRRTDAPGYRPAGSAPASGNCARNRASR